MLHKKLKFKYVLAASLIAVFALPQICMADITYGPESVFNSDNTICKSAATLDATHALIAYWNYENNSCGTAVIATIADTISYGIEFVFNNARTGFISVTALDATHALIAYQDAGNNNYGTAVIATISGGNNISYGTEFVFNSAYTHHISATALDATHALIAYQDNPNSSSGTSIIASISGGNNISYGPEFVFDTNTNYISVTALDATHALIAYQDAGNSASGTAVIATISDTISYGPEFVFNSASTTYISATALDATHVLIAYQDAGNNLYGIAVLATISGGNNISCGPEFVFNSTSTLHISATALNATHAFIAYMDWENSDANGTAVIATISGGNNISCGPEFVFNNAITNYISATALDATHALIAYSDNGNSNYGTGILATLPPIAPAVSTQSAYNIGSDCATLSGNITDTGGLDSDMIAFEWDTDSGAPYAYIWIELGTYGTGAFSHTISNLESGTTYYFRAKAHNTISRCWGYGNEESFTTSTCLVDGTKFKESKLENYPNPFRSRTKISYAINNRLKSAPVEIRIYNVTGQLVETISATNGIAEWDSGNLPSGIYFYKLMIENSSEINKMILIK